MNTIRSENKMSLTEDMRTSRNGGLHRWWLVCAACAWWCAAASSAKALDVTLLSAAPDRPLPGDLVAIAADQIPWAAGGLYSIAHWNEGWPPMPPGCASFYPGAQFFFQLR